MSYAPQTIVDFSLYLPRYGILGMWVGLKPDAVDGAFATMESIAADLAARPISADQLERAVKPIVKAATRARQGNGYWISALAGAQADSHRLDLSVRTIGDLESLTPTDIQAAAQHWLVKERKLWMKVVPEGS